MTLPNHGWYNKAGTGSRGCACGSWAQHWINFAQAPWPEQCVVASCSSKPTLGGHVANPAVAGERIAPLCAACNSRTDTFSLKGGVSLPSANQTDTCAG